MFYLFHFVYDRESAWLRISASLPLQVSDAEVHTTYLLYRYTTLIPSLYYSQKPDSDTNVINRTTTIFEECLFPVRLIIGRLNYWPWMLWDSPLNVVTCDLFCSGRPPKVAPQLVPLSQVALRETRSGGATPSGSSTGDVSPAQLPPGISSLPGESATVSYSKVVRNHTRDTPILLAWYATNTTTED